MTKEEFFNQEPIVYKGVKLKIVEYKRCETSCKECYFDNILIAGYCGKNKCYAYDKRTEEINVGIYVKVED